MRRKTDFFSQEEKSIKTVHEIMQKHCELFMIDKKKQELIQRKKDEQKAAQKPKVVKVDKNDTGEGGATVEEITDEEAKRMELAELKVKQQAAKLIAEKEGKKEKKEGEEDEEKSLK